MGLFLFISAIKNKSPLEISTAIQSYLAPRNIKANVKTYSEWTSRNQKEKIDIHDFISQPISITSIHPPQQKWSTVIYNNCPFDEKEVSQFLSVQLRTLISLIEVYDSEVWYHYLYFNGKQVDQFCSSPEEYEERENWGLLKGNVKKISFYFEIEEDIIEPYFFQFNSENRPHIFNKKAHDDDEHPLGNEWVFIDFWKKLGINYPSIAPEIVIIHEESF